MASREHAVHEPVAAALAVEPQRLATRAPAHKIIAANIRAIPPARLDALGTGDELEFRSRRVAPEWTGHREEPQRPQREETTRLSGCGRGGNERGQSPCPLGTVIGAKLEGPD